MHIARFVGISSIAALSSFLGCSSGADEAYKPPYPAYSGAKKANMPPVPTLPSTPIKTGDAYTVYGATHHLRSDIHRKDVTANAITLVGYIVETNLATAPECAIHPAGKADPANCTAPIPSFAIADTKGDTKGARIKVIGWARNYAILYDSMKEYDKLKAGEKPKEPIKDDQLNKDIPFPLPVAGAKVKVTGRYNFSGRASGDMVSDPQNGAIVYDHIGTLEPATEKAAFAKKI